MAQFNENIILKSGAYVKNLKISTEVDAESIIAGVFKAVTDGNDITDIQVCSNGIDWFSLRGYKAENMASEADGRVPIYEGLTADGKKFQFRVLKAGQEIGESSPSLSISQSSGVITIDLGAGTKEELAKIKNKVEKEFKTGSITDYKVLSDNNFSDALKARLETIQIKEDPLNAGQYILVYNNGTNDVKLGENIDITAAIVSGSVKECDTINEPVTGYKVGDKYIDFVLAGGEEHVYILVSDLVDVMQGYEGDEIKTIINGQTVKAELLNNSVVMARLKAIAANTIGEITPTDTQIANNTAIRIEDAVRLFAANIAYLFTNKANKLQSIAAIEASSTQLSTPNPTQDIALDIILQKALNNIKYLFDNKANSDHLHEGVYLKPTDVVDNITDSSTIKPLSANQGKMLGGLINERIKGVRVDGIELTPDPNKIVEVPIMQGATPSLNGKAGLVPKPLSGQQSAFLRGDGSYGVPNADVVATASYIGGTTPVPNGMTCTVVDNGNNGHNVEIILTNAYVSRDLFPAAVDIVQVMRNGLDLVDGEDFTIEEDISLPRKKITLIDYPLHTDSDIIIVRYKTSIGVYGSIFQTSLEECIDATSEAITASERAENAAIEAENIADSKIDKAAIVDKLGTDPNKLMSQKATTDAIMKSYNYDVNQLAYGVRLDLTGNGQTLERVGNLSLHKTRPITSKARNCVKNVAGVNYYLSNDTDLLKADGVTPSVLDGTDGDVMKEIPELYVREYTEDNYAYTYISEFPLPNFIRIPKTYHGLYEGSYDTTTNQTRSVINATIRTGLPATGQSRSYYNNGARLNRNITWNIDTLLSNYVRELLFRVDYATYDSQAPYNSQPTAEGYLQGGLGAGVTGISYNKWRYNGYNPFIPCGYTAELGNRTGVKDFYMPYEYDGWSSVSGDNTGYYKGIYNASTPYNVDEYVADTADSSIGQGDGKLYKCILTAPAGTVLTNTTYFTEQVRTKVEVNRFLVEIPFGHTSKHTIDSIIELTDGYTATKCYIYDNPEHYPTSNTNDIKTANARFLCNMPSAEGYVKTFNKYTLVPYAIGGSSNSWGYDYYYWRGEAGGVLRGLLFGGFANYGANAGFGFSYAYFSPSYAHAYFGVRLCCFEENIVINS